MAARQAAARASTPGPAGATGGESMLARARGATPRGEYVEMPMLGRVWVELPGEMVVDEIEGAVFKAMADLGLPLTPVNAMTYNSRRLALTLAWAVRHPDRHAEQAGGVDEWTAIDIDMLSAFGEIYTDVRERLSPFASGLLTQEQLDAIRQGIEKKNAMLLRSVGVVALSSWLLSTAVPPASSPPTPSSTGG